MDSKYKRLVESTIVETAPAVAAARLAIKSTIKKNKKTDDEKSRQTRDWLVNKSLGAKQSGTSNRITSGNATTNASSDHNKERQEEINYNITQQGQPPVKDDDKHNELVTQTSKASSPQDVSNPNNKKLKSKVNNAIGASDWRAKKQVSVGSDDGGESRKGINKLAVTKSAARGVLGVLITNM